MGLSPISAMLCQVPAQCTRNRQPCRPAVSPDRLTPQRASSLDNSSTSDQLIHNSDDGKHQQNMDQPSSDVKHSEAEQPKNKQYDYNGPNHNDGLYEKIMKNINSLDGISFRSS
jgi:hypothetical protein